MIVGIGMGSNMGDKRRHLVEATDFLRSLGGTVRVSGYYESAPLECPPGSDVFLNAVAEMDYPGDAIELLGHLQRYETDHGRPVHRERNAPRPIDLDILYAGDLKCDTEQLTLPHPRLAERLFVLEPLAELAPQRLIPGPGQSVMELLVKCRIQAKDQLCRRLE